MYVSTIILFVASLAPIAILLWYFDNLDKKEKESRRFLWSIFLWGVLATFIAGAIEYLSEETFLGFFSNPLTQLIVISFISTATVEEGLKYWVVKKKAYNHPAFNEYYDGIIYTVVASLGFAAMENIFYVLEGGLYVAIIRALLTVPAHALFGAIMGYNISLARFATNKTDEKRFLRKGLLLAIFFHGLYDFLLLTSSSLALFVIPILLGLWIYLKRKIQYLHFMDKIPESKTPRKWTVWTYIRTFIGMIFFTLGLLTMLVTALYVTSDPLGQDLLTNFSPLIALIFTAVVWAIAYALIRNYQQKNDILTS